MKLTSIAKKLRTNQTEAEKLLWSCLRAKQLEGIKFRRQEPIGSYIVDFICYEIKLVIELDGGQHMDPEQASKDKLRDQWLRSQGYRVIRFWDSEIFKNLSGVLEKIRARLIKPL